MKRIVSYNDTSAYQQVSSPQIRVAVDHSLNSRDGSLGGDVVSSPILPDTMGISSGRCIDSVEDSECEGPSDTLVTRRLAIVMCGLPGVGKTASARALSRYLNWIGFTCAIFNVGEKRRELLGSSQPAEFFDPENEQGRRARWEVAKETFCEMLAYLAEADNEESSLEHRETGLESRKHGHVAIYDATNTTRQRREFIRTELDRRGIRVLFWENICRDSAILQNNVMQTKMWSPDYKTTDPELAVIDFLRRIDMYKKAYEEITETENCSFIQVLDAGRQIKLNQIRGFLPSKIVSYLINSRFGSVRSIYLTRHGQSEYNVQNRLGGNPGLTSRGKQYSKELAKWAEEEFTLRGRPLPTVWTSQLRRTRETIEFLPCTISTCWRALNEIDAGVCDGMTYEEVFQQMPELADARKQDKLRFRYPKGESYVDVIHRLEPVILEIERQQEPLIIVAHRAIIRCIYGFFMGIDPEAVPKVDVPLHTLFKLTPRPYDCEMVTFQLLPGDE